MWFHGGGLAAGHSYAPQHDGNLKQIYHLAPIYAPDAPEPLQAGEVSASPSAIVTQDPGLANLAILPVDTQGRTVRVEKGRTSPAVGWYGVLGEFPAWDATLHCREVLPVRLDAVLYPMAPGKTQRPVVRRLRRDAQVTAFRIPRAGLDDTFILCKEGAGPVTVDGVTFEGRALLVMRVLQVQTMAVAPVTVQVDGLEM